MRYLASLLPLLAALLVAAPAWAVPAQLAHQGRLLDAGGAPLEGSHTLTFALFDADIEGAEVWSEDIDVVLTGGFYSVVLGADEDGNPLDELVLGGGALWLELRVDGGEPLLPRHELLSVPYAVIAGTASNVEGGYVDATEIAVDGEVVIDGEGNWTGPTPDVDWSDLSGVPGGLQDGEDADTLGSLVCPDGEVPKYETASGNWVCGPDEVLDSVAVLGIIDGAVVNLGTGSAVDGTPIATLDDLSWDLLSDIPPEFAGGEDSDTLAALTCADGARPRWDDLSSLWVCDQVTWGELAGIPTELLDGDADALGGLSCADGGIAVFDLGAGIWGCGTDAVLESAEVLGFVDGAVVNLGVGSSVGGVVLATVDDLTWGVLAGIPAGFLDEVDDDTLADLGFTGCGDGHRPSWDGITSQWLCDGVTWAEVQGVPAELADGFDADTLAALSPCSDGGIAVYDSSVGAWTCGTDQVLTSDEVLGFVDGATVDLGAGSSMASEALATLLDLTWGNLSGIPGGFADGFDADTLMDLALACGDGDRPSWDLVAGDWECVEDAVLTEQEVEDFVLDEPLDLPAGSTLDGETISTGSGGLFGGTGEDGPLIITSGTTTLDLGGEAYFIRNYTELEISGSGQLAFSNPNDNGTIVILRSQGDAEITSPSVPAVDLVGLGAAGGVTYASSSGLPGTGVHTWMYGHGTAFWPSSNLYVPYGQPGNTGAQYVGRGGQAYSDWFTEPLVLSRAIRLAAGSGGGHGGELDTSSSSPDEGGDGGRGGGALYVEVGGVLTLTGVVDSSGAAGDDAGAGCAGGGGGGSAGAVVILYDTAASLVGSVLSLGGDGGIASSDGCPSGYPNVKGGGGAGGIGGDGGKSTDLYTCGNAIGGGGGAGSGGPGESTVPCSESGGAGGPGGAVLLGTNTVFP